MGHKTCSFIIMKIFVFPAIQYPDPWVLCVRGIFFFLFFFDKWEDCKVCAESDIWINIPGRIKDNMRSDKMKN